jgi:DNA-binding CsgD family transcriptional regulator
MKMAVSGATRKLFGRQQELRNYLSARTVDRHVSRVFQKLGVSSRAAAASVFERTRRDER